MRMIAFVMKSVLPLLTVLSFAVAEPESPPSLTPNNTYFTTSFFPRPWTPQYASFYPKYNSRLQKLSTTICADTLRDYAIAFHAPKSSPFRQNLLSICYQHEECLLDNIPSGILANFNCATVVLGLMPTLLSTIGPNLAELALFGVHRPILGLLVALGAPAIWPSRLLEYNDPSRILKDAGNDARGKPLTLHLPSRWQWAAAPLSALQYILALAAVANVLLTSLDLGSKSILSWGCTTTITPVLWTSLPSVVYIVVALSSAYARKSAYNKAKNLEEDDHARTGPLKGHTNNLLSSLMILLKKETTLCWEQQLHQHDENADVPRSAVLGNVLSGCGGFVHLVFGIIIFSSLQFVSVWDVLNHVLWRYVLSAVVCRLILVIEIAGMRGKPGAK